MGLDNFQNDVIRTVKDYINNSKFSYIFSGHIKIEHFSNQILFEIYKELYLESSDKRSLRSYVPLGNTFDAQYQLKKRTLAYSKYYKEELKKELIEDGFDINDLSGLNIPEKKSMQEKLSGHSLNTLENTQLETMNKIELLESIISKRVVSSKKVSNTRFVEMFEELDKFYCEIKGSTDKEAYIQNLINFYDIERHYSTQLIYSIASYIDEQNIKQFNIDDFSILFAIRIEEVNCICYNNFIYKQHDYIDDIYNKRRTSLNQLLNILYLKLLLVKNNRKELRTSLTKFSGPDIHKYLKQNYNLFELHHNEKKWNNKRIRIARNFYDRFFKNIELPEIRT